MLVSLLAIVYRVQQTAIAIAVWIALGMVVAYLRVTGVEAIAESMLASTTIPVIYAFTYYYRMVSGKEKYVVEEGEEAYKQESIHLVELYALIISFMVGYITYIAWFGYTDIIAYTIGYIIVQSIRVCVWLTMSVFRKLGVDTEKPLNLTLIGVLVGAVHILEASIILYLVGLVW